LILISAKGSGDAHESQQYNEKDHKSFSPIKDTNVEVLLNLLVIVGS
jgi:hypothetical protein